MPKKTAPKLVPFTITLPAETIALMERLPDGYYTKSRAELARQLILDQLKHLGAPVIADALKRRRARKGPK